MTMFGKLPVEPKPSDPSFVKRDVDEVIRVSQTKKGIKI